MLLIVIPWDSTTNYWGKIKATGYLLDSVAFECLNKDWWAHYVAFTDLSLLLVHWCNLRNSELAHLIRAHTVEVTVRSYNCWVMSPTSNLLNHNIEAAGSRHVYIIWPVKHLILMLLLELQLLLHKLWVDTELAILVFTPHKDLRILEYLLLNHFVLLDEHRLVRLHLNRGCSDAFQVCVIASSLYLG